MLVNGPGGHRVAGAELGIRGVTVLMTMIKCQILLYARYYQPVRVARRSDISGHNGSADSLGPAEQGGSSRRLDMLLTRRGPP